MTEAIIGLIAAGIGLIGAFGGAWLTARATARETRRDQLRATWGEWTASALEAVHRFQALHEAERDPSTHFAPDATVAPPIDSIRRDSEMATWRLRRDHHHLGLLEPDDHLLAAANTITNELIDQEVDEKRANGALLLTRHLAHFNRARFLQRKYRGPHPEPLPPPDEIRAILEGRMEGIAVGQATVTGTLTATGALTTARTPAKNND